MAAVSRPINFSRYPSWCCYAIASLGALATEHCVDHIIGIERACTIDSGWRLWRHFADLCGWRVPDSKSLPPTDCRTVLGAEVNLQQFPQSPAVIRITARRIEVLQVQLNSILASGQLSSGLAGQVWGKLQHACSMLWGRYGAAKLRPFARRQRESLLAINPQLRSSIDEWIKALEANSFPREVRLFGQDPRTLISYSDGEGSEAGVGVALWLPEREQPVACYLKCPREVRVLWSTCQHLANDIFQIEAVGPLVALATWPELLHGCLWIHFIDNAAAQSALIKGSSSVMSGDLIVGQTWELIARRRIAPWFDTVGISSNPVDGLSRGRLSGPWNSVQQGVLPRRLLSELRRWHFGAASAW